MRWATGLWIAVGLAALGCEDEAHTCAALGQVIDEGEHVIDEEAGLYCVCLASGPSCRPLELVIDQGPRLGDLGALDAARPDAQPADAQPDVTVDPTPPDAGPADADVADAEIDAGPGPEDCPSAVPFGDCTGLTGLICDYGAQPFYCCAREYRAEATCSCTQANTWTCVSQRGNCARSEVGARCLREDAVCAAWTRIVEDQVGRADADYDWGGDRATCQAGDMGEAWRARALDRLNDWRTLADLPSVRMSPERNALAQACALAIDAGGVVTHTLDADAPCYTPEAARGAAESTVMIGAGPIGALWHYLEDWGDVNWPGLPHRLWVLSNRVGPVGFGATDRASCMHVARGSADAGADFALWPAAGPFPFDAHRATHTGWSIQSDRINLGRATVSVRRVADDQPMPITQRRLAAEGGAGHGLAFVPDGWAASPGERYQITVDGLPEPLSYEVDFVDCAHGADLPPLHPQTAP